MYDTILSPLTLGGVTLKNRVIFAPTTLGLRGEALADKLQRIASGGCAMVILGDVPVAKHGARSLHSRKGFDQYHELCQRLHAEGCLVCAQLHQSDSNWKAMVKYVPGVLTKKITMADLRPLLNAQVGKLVTDMPAKKVRAITASFGEAAALAKEAGFDMIQVHGDRMCGSFSSAIFNQRTDEYGGSAINRARFAVEAVTAVHQAVPDMPIDYKLAVRQEEPHYGNAGVLLAELAVFVPRLEAAGVTSFHVTLADHGQLTDTIPPKNHPAFAQEGCFLPYVDQVRRYTTLPICGVGGLTDPDFVEAQLASGRIDCAAMSRQLLADPDWPRKVAEGRADAVRRCVRCNQKCLGGLQKHEGVHCIYEAPTDRHQSGDV